MKKEILLFLSLFSLISLNAQESESPKTKNNLFKINILTPGLTFEKSISDNSSLCLDANLGLVYTFSSNLGNRLLKTPFTRLQYSAIF